MEHTPLKIGEYDTKKHLFRIEQVGGFPVGWIGYEDIAKSIVHACNNYQDLLVSLQALTWAVKESYQAARPDRIITALKYSEAAIEKAEEE